MNERRRQQRMPWVSMDARVKLSQGADRIHLDQCERG